jgi:DNA-binding GntR family transcriptional regulator
MTKSKASPAAPTKARTQAVAATGAAAPVRQEILQRLTQAITEGQYLPGDKLVERELCERFGVSRTSLREALRQLEAEQLVEIIPNRGPLVRGISEDELLELWEMRAAIESVAARRFALRGSDEEVARLEGCIVALERALRVRDTAAIRQRKNEFFEAFARGGHSVALPRFLQQLNARLSFLWTSSLRLPGRPEESIAELKTLLAAIKARNPEVAHAAIVIYNSHAREVSLQGLRALYAERRGEFDDTP